MNLPLPVASYELPSPQAGCQRLLNCYVEQAQTKKQPVLLRRAPGIAPLGEVEGEAIACRGFDVMAGVLYGVIGTGFYSINVDTGATTQITGTIPGSTRVRMANNGTDLVINLDDGSAYHYNGSTLAVIVNATFTGWGGRDVTYLDSYFAFRRPGTNQIFSSGLNAVTFNALDITSIDGRPGDVVGLITNNRELVIPKEASSELWYNAANAVGSPFSRSPSGLKEVGCLAGDSLVNQDNSPFMLANDKTFRRLESVWARVSQHGIEAALQRMDVISDCYAIPHTMEGHLFVAFSFPSAGRTFVFDITTQQWHERDSLGYGSWRVNCIATVGGKQIVGDRLSGKFGILSSETFEEWEEPQRVRWTYAPIYAQRDRVSLRRFELSVASGQGLTVGQGSDPLATLRLSKDGGETFTTRPVRSLGVRGNYSARAVWWNNGMARDFVAQVEVTDPIPLFTVDTQILADGARL